jgi:hypothetical protein
MLKHLDDDTHASTGLQACQKFFLNVRVDSLEVQLVTFFLLTDECAFYSFRSLEPTNGQCPQ